ncbi:esterase E4-like [Cydia fagiglandana]|uniref:esterase E4-like n=1 Tax=Cydia fagiglandana TaxID=1458189 RepID=UPI002FEE2E80
MRKRTILALCYVKAVVCIFTPEVRVEQGVLRGLRSISGQRRYYGIPYAVSERFQSPRDPPPWRGTFLAVNRFGACAQSVSFLTLGSEHCLHLDVYTPATSSKLPVLVFIHGGAYYYGTKAHYDPEYLVTKNVIAVIINYRVGVLGFLCLNGVSNLGLKDQVAALKWIRRNIGAFGGDPDNVTIAGQSAGASAAAMHLLSKSSDGLFHKAIFMSGTPLSPWAFNLEPLKPAFEDAGKLGLVKTERDVYNTFMNATLKDLLKTTHDRSVSTRYFKYSPCIDVNFPESFFWDTPYKVIQSESFRPIPMVLGYADVEGMLFYGLNSDRDFQEWDSKFDQRLPSVFSLCSKLEKRKIVKKLRSYYFGGKKISSKNVKGVVNYYSDWIAYASVNAFSKLMVDKSAPVYNYIFSYEGGRNFAKGLIGYKAGLRGASHSDDIFYIFKPAGLGLPVSSEDRLFIERLTTMLANFMKFGDPTPHRTPLLPVLWPRANASLSTPTLRLDRQSTVISAPESHQGRLLLKLLCRYGQKGFVPCESEERCGKE